MGKSTVFANSQGIATTDSGDVVISGPDVCLTPMGPALVPVPYTNTGDLPGIGTGVSSGTVGSTAEFINSSFDVKIEGKGVCRNSDPMTQNNKNAI
jgi:hypothetical protein